MKQVKIKSGDYEAMERSQFKVMSTLCIDPTWLKNELRRRIAERIHPTAALSIYIARGSPGPHTHYYTITFAPHWGDAVNELLTIADIIAELMEIEDDLRKAIRTRHLLNGLEE